MKKITFIAIFVLSIVFSAFAGTLTNEEAVEEKSMMYIEGFYEGDQEKLKNCLDPDLNKFGFWKDEKSKAYGDKIPMTFERALEYAENVKVKKQFPKSDAPKKVVVMDVLDKIAISRVHGWWGVDYMLLAKNDGKWMIRQIIWEGPNQTASPTEADKEAVKNAGLGYVEGFYEGDPEKLKNSLRPNMYKYGYGFDRKKGKYRDGSQMTFDQAISLAKRFKEKNQLPKPSVPKKVEVLEVRDKIAAVKITAWWGFDYMLLSKDGDKWMIDQIIWAGYPAKKKS